MRNGHSGIETLTGLLLCPVRAFLDLPGTSPPHPTAGTDWGLWVGTQGLPSVVMRCEGLAQLLKAAAVVSATWGHCVQGY